MKKIKNNNKGFSLVELIIVIAIMAVLVGIIAPQFFKYIESSRRSTDVKNAQEIAAVILAEAADGNILATPGQTLAAYEAALIAGGAASPSLGTSTILKTLGGTIPTQKATLHKGQQFWVVVTKDATTGAAGCTVYAGDGAATTVLYPTPVAPYAK